MSKMVETKELGQRDVFEMAQGSVYVVVAAKNDAGTQQMRLWCAHDPEPITFDPPLINLPAGDTVRLLSSEEAYVHHLHPGYVEAAFRTEMDRRHHGNMGNAQERMNREKDEQHERDRAARPWWKKMFG